MVTVRTRLIRIGFILGLLAILASGASLEPKQAMARPVGTGGPDGNPYGNGDPTGDDVPSPTPKPGAVRIASSGARPDVLALRQGSIGSPDRWSVYLSILIRLGIR